VEDLVEGLRGRITSLSYRVPTAAVCYGNIGAILRRDTTAAEVLDALQGELSRTVRFSAEPLVSTDLIGDEASAIIDLRWLTVEGGRFLGLSGYDNEWGYCHEPI
jgi:glyceraldehyde 3-phosphate dehydrogenase